MDSRIIEIESLDAWLNTPPGQYVLAWEQAQLDRVVADLFGFHALQMGMPLLKSLRANRMPHRWVGSQEVVPGHTDLVLDPTALPFPEQSLDLVVLPHTLELSQDPHATLREVHRVLVPEGKLVVCGFNPASLWGLRQRRAHWGQRLGFNSGFLPQAGEFIGYWRLRDWSGVRPLAGALCLDGRGRRSLVAHFGCSLFAGGHQTRSWHAPHSTGLAGCTFFRRGSRDQRGLGACSIGRMSELNTVVIYTDGACKGNPGPGGWGALLQSGTKEKELWGGEPHTTNNRMELLAVIEALRALKRPCRVELYLDSQYVRQGITEWIHKWKVQGWRTSSKQPVKNVELWQTLDDLVQGHGHQIRWHWVKGHAGDPGNERADALANRGAAENMSVV